MITHLPLWFHESFGAPRQSFRSTTGANFQAQQQINHTVIIRNHRQILIVVTGKE